MAEVHKGAKMENATYSALYYPSIEFADPQWLWASSLIWDRIYRIVPKDYAAGGPLINPESNPVT
jgi:hypothetical protein